MSGPEPIRHSPSKAGCMRPFRRPTSMRTFLRNTKTWEFPFQFRTDRLQMCAWTCREDKEWTHRKLVMSQFENQETNSPAESGVGHQKMARPGWFQSDNPTGWRLWNHASRDPLRDHDALTTEGILPISQFIDRFVDRGDSGRYPTTLFRQLSGWDRIRWLWPRCPNRRTQGSRLVQGATIRCARCRASGGRRLR